MQEGLQAHSESGGQIRTAIGYSGTCPRVQGLSILNCHYLPDE